MRTIGRQFDTDTGDNSGNAQTNAAVLKIFCQRAFFKNNFMADTHFAHLPLPA